jgi:hypothetical protein
LLNKVEINNNWYLNMISTRYSDLISICFFFLYKLDFFFSFNRLKVWCNKTWCWLDLQVLLKNHLCVRSFEEWFLSGLRRTENLYYKCYVDAALHQNSIEKVRCLILIVSIHHVQYYRCKKNMHQIFFSNYSQIWSILSGFSVLT